MITLADFSRFNRPLTQTLCYHFHANAPTKPIKSALDKIMQLYANYVANKDKSILFVIRNKRHYYSRMIVIYIKINTYNVRYRYERFTTLFFLYFAETFNLRPLTATTN